MKKYVFLAALMFAHMPAVVASESQHQEPAAHAGAAVVSTPEHEHAAHSDMVKAPPMEHEPAVEAVVQKRVVSMQEMRSALKKGKPELEKLVKEGGDLNAKDPRTGMTLLHEAASEGNVARIQTLHEVGADMNVVNNQGATALHMAATIGHINAAKKLVEVGVPTHLKSLKGQTAFEAARDRGNKPISTFLENHPK